MMMYRICRWSVMLRDSTVSFNLAMAGLITYLENFSRLPSVVFGVSLLICLHSCLGAGKQFYIVMKLANYAGHNVTLKPSGNQVAKGWFLKKGFAMTITMGTLNTNPVTFIAHFADDDTHLVAINGKTNIQLTPKLEKTVHMLKVSDTGETSWCRKCMKQSKGKQRLCVQVWHSW